MIKVGVGLFFLCVFGVTQAQQTIKVPNGNGTPVLIDGRISEDEWRDALSLNIDPSIRLYLKQFKGHVYLALKADRESPIYVDLFLLDGDHRLHNLHASMQIGERLLSGNEWTDQSPPTNWGNHVDWIANEAKVDEQKDKRLTFIKRLFPRDGVEVQIRRLRFIGQRWRLRIEVRDFAGLRPDKVFPATSERKNSGQWLTLDLGPNRI
jgi:hypothetical protein